MKEDHLVSIYFRTEKEFSPIEKRALALCQGKVLDIGAGVGPDSLELQRLGLEVLAIDISSHACEIMRKRGVLNVKCTTVYGIDEKNFDTIHLMGRSIGFVEDLQGLKRFLKFCKDLLNPGGIILLDSIDIRETTDSVHLAYQEENLKSGRYIGEIRLQMEYNGFLGEKFQILHVDHETLENCAQDLGWACKILYKEKNGAYLAQIFK